MRLGERLGESPRNKAGGEPPGVRLGESPGNKAGGEPRE